MHVRSANRRYLDTSKELKVGLGTFADQTQHFGMVFLMHNMMEALLKIAGESRG